MTHKSQTTALEEAPSVIMCENETTEKNPTIIQPGMDDALQMAIDGQDETWTEQEERRVLRKIDMVLIPLV